MSGAIHGLNRMSIGRSMMMHDQYGKAHKLKIDNVELGYAHKRSFFLPLYGVYPVAAAPLVPATHRGGGTGHFIRPKNAPTLRLCFPLDLIRAACYGTALDDELISIGLMSMDKQIAAAEDRLWLTS